MATPRSRTDSATPVRSAASPDPLSEFLADFHANTVVTGHFTLHEPWSIDKEAVHGVPFRLCSGAPYYIQPEGHAPVRVEAGDVVLLPHGTRHRLCSDLDHPPRPFFSLLAEQGVVPRYDTPLAFEASGTGPVCELHTAIVGFPEGERHRLFSILPPLIHLRDNDPAISPWLKLTLRTLIEDSMACRPGWMIAATRLSEVLLIHMIRAHLYAHMEHGVHWVAGLFDPQIGKPLLEILRAPGADWSLEKLADLAAMSRSRFAERFTQLVGVAPMTYVTQLRMSAAAKALASPGARISRVAADAGYESEKAFTRAFKRWAGVSPGSYGRQQAGRQTGALE
jgi:AraC family transcriptional regulator, alkane utilization regulator